MCVGNGDQFIAVTPTGSFRGGSPGALLLQAPPSMPWLPSRHRLSLLPVAPCPRSGYLDPLLGMELGLPWERWLTQKGADLGRQGRCEAPGKEGPAGLKSGGGAASRSDPPSASAPWGTFPPGGQSCKGVT